jgi:hypothetical protein
MKEKKQIDWKQAYQNMLRWVKSTGYESVYYRALAKGQRKLKAPEDTFRIKEKITTRPDGLEPILNYPNYYINDQGHVYCDSNKRKCWIQITQQQLKSGYKQVQLYNPAIEKKTLYVHRLLWEAFNGAIPDGYEIHHVNSINSDNYLMNLECIEKTIHRKMPKPRKNK